MNDGIFKVSRNGKFGPHMIIWSKGSTAASFHRKLEDALGDDVHTLKIETDNDSIDLTALRKCTHLERLDLHMASKTVEKMDLGPLGHLPVNTIELHFPEADVSGIDLSFLNGMEDIKDFQITSRAGQFSILKHEEEFRVWTWPSTQATFFQQMLRGVLPEDVSELTIYTQRDSIDLSFLPEYKHLTGFELEMDSKTVEEVDLGPIGRTGIKKLKLRFKGHIYSGEEIGPTTKHLDLSFLRGMSDLEDIEIMGISGTLDLSAIADCHALKHFTLGNLSLANIDLRPLSSCEDLKELVVEQNYSKCRLTMPDLRGHANIKSIGIRHFVGARPSPDDPGSTVFDLSGLEGCQSLRVLDLGQNSAVNELDLSPLSTCEHLQRIGLVGCHNLKELDLTPLGSLPALEYLDISLTCPYDRIDLTPLGTCKSLKRLYVQNDTNKDNNISSRSYEVYELDVTSLFKLENLEYVLLFKRYLNDISWRGDLSSNELPKDRLDFHYKYLKPLGTIRQWLERGVKGPCATMESLPTKIVVGEMEPEVLVDLSRYGPDEFVGVSDANSSDERELIEYLVAAFPLTPKLLADSSVVPESERNPRWARAYNIEWY